MKALGRRALIVALLEKMREQLGSWCGETHVQKSAYVCQEGLGVPFEYDFVMYKHGPFSFDLREELASMEADSLLEMNVRPYPYGPSLSSGPLAPNLLGQFPKTLAKYGEQLEFVARELAKRGVVDLERITTALYVGREFQLKGLQERADAVRRLKPHIAPDEALDAVRTADRLLKTAEEEGIMVS